MNHTHVIVFKFKGKELKGELSFAPELIYDAQFKGFKHSEIQYVSKFVDVFLELQRSVGEIEELIIKKK